LARLRVEPVDRVGEGGTEEASASLGHHRAASGRVEDNFDASSRAVLFESDDRVHGAGQPGTEPGDGNASSFTDSLGHLRMV
jgi:hypothetical protein